MGALKRVPARVEPIERDPNPGLRSGVLHGIYDILWVVVGVLGSPLFAWRALRSKSFRGMLAERTGLRRAKLPRLDPGRRRLLIHAVSVGEVKGAMSLVRRMQAERPDLEPVISSTTSTGLTVARDLFPELTVLRFPADASLVIGPFISSIDPLAILLVELEVWPNFLRAANRRGIPIAVVNGRITEGAFGRYQLFRRFFPQFNRISLFCVQNATYAERFLELGVPPERLLITGNVKVDGLGLGSVEPGADLRRLIAAEPGRLVLVAGSTHEPEEQVVLAAWRAARADLRLVLVPRHPKRVPELVERLGPAAGQQPAVQRLSELRAGAVELDSALPLIVDTVGELEQVYGTADIVFVGGSLAPLGGHNVLEPAAQGKPVVCGPSRHNFVQEVALLEDAEASMTVSGEAQLTEALERLAADPERRAQMGAAGRKAIETQRGATATTWEALGGLLGSGAP